MLQPVRGEVRKVLNRGAEMSIVLCRTRCATQFYGEEIYTKCTGEAVNGSEH
jgi:hypothetical protein